MTNGNGTPNALSPAAVPTASGSPALGSAPNSIHNYTYHRGTSGNVRITSNQSGIDIQSHTTRVEAHARDIIIHVNTPASSPPPIIPQSPNVHRDSPTWEPEEEPTIPPALESISHEVENTLKEAIMSFMSKGHAPAGNIDTNPERA